MKTINPDILKERIEKSVNNDLKENNISGAALAVIQNGKLIYKNCFGATVPCGDIPVKDTTIFRMASMTKPITAVAAMILVERGLIDLDDNVDKYFPEYGQMNVGVFDDDGKLTNSLPAVNKIKIFHLLSHASGLGSGDASEYCFKKMTDTDKKDLDSSVNFYADMPLGFDPFTAQAYSGTAAFNILSAIIEKVSDSDYNTFLKKEIFEPCNMPDTTFTPNDEQWSRIIAMHEKQDGKSCIGNTWNGCVFESYPPTIYLGGAGLISTLNDYCNFALMLLNKGEINGSRIISEKSVAAIATPHIPQNLQPGHERWGLGVRVIVSDEYKYLPVGAFGWSGAYGTHFWIDPINNIAAVYMKNSRYDGGAACRTAQGFEQDVFNSLE